jgi:hypothetical protein
MMKAKIHDQEPNIERRNGSKTSWSGNCKKAQSNLRINGFIRVGRLIAEMGKR